MSTFKDMLDDDLDIFFNDSEFAMNITHIKEDNEETFIAIFDTNSEIKEAYKTAGNIRIGAEYNVTKAISLRGGYELNQSAFNTNSFEASQPNADADLMVYSAGLGFHVGTFFADVAYRYSVLDNYNLPYGTPSAAYPAPKLIGFNNVKNDVLFTIGYKF